MRSIIFAVWFVLLPWQVVQAQPVLLDRIVAVVDDDVILESELRQEIESVRLQLQQNKVQIPPLPTLERQVLERLIVKHIQLERADKSGIRIDDQQLDQTLTQIAAQNQLSLAEFATALANEGIDYAIFRENLRGDMKIAQLQRRFSESAVVVADQEIDHYLINQALQQSDQEVRYQLGHILIAIDDATDEAETAAAAAKADALLAQLNGGADFSALAIEHSDAASATQGGVNDFRTVRQLPSIFAEAVVTMKEGENAGPFYNSSGLHIIRLLKIENSLQRIVKQVRSRHILLRSSQIVSDAEARIRLEQIREQVLAGESFEVLAKANSEDRVSGLQGGDLGWAGPGQFVPEFEKELDRLDLGEISPVFKSRYGWHLIQLIERREHDETEAWLRLQAREQIAQRKGEEEYTAWLRRLRNEAYIEIRI